MFKRSLSRGVSIVAALALVGVLSVVLVFAQVILPDASGLQSQTAAAPEAAVSKSANPAIPNCSTIQDGTKVDIKTAEDAAKRPCACQNPVTSSNKQKTFQGIKYSVGAVLLSGNSVAEYKQYKVPGAVAEPPQKCVVENCPMGVAPGSSGCRPSTSTSAGLGDTLIQAGNQSVQAAPKSIAQGLVEGTVNLDDLKGKMSQSMQSQVSDAFNEIKANNNTYSTDTGGSTGTTYTDERISSAQDDLNSLATCGDTDCSTYAEPDPNAAATDKALALNQDLTTRQQNLQAQCDAGACDANDQRTLATLQNQVSANQRYLDLKQQCDAGSCDANDQRTLAALQQQAQGQNPSNQTFTNGDTPGSKTPPVDPGQKAAPPAGPGGGNPGGGGGNQAGNKTGGLGNIGSALQSFLGGLMRGITGAGAQPAGPACPSDPSAYAAQQQQYQQQMQQYQYQLQQYQYYQQQQQLQAQTMGYATVAQPIPPAAPVPCTPSASTNTCAAAPAQPSTACPAGTTLRPITAQQSNGASCTTGWQCAAGGSTAPTAQISCQPLVADVGMAISISFGCTNATGSQSGGFNSLGATSGSTSTILAAPPAGVTTATFGITCINQNLSGQASCSVQVARPSIVLVANPKVVATSTASTVGWVTSGMSSCVVSSPQQSDFTATNAGNTSVSGMATTSPITEDTDILLHCITLGGGTRDATTTITASGVGDGDATGAVSVSSSADGASIARGGTNTIQWSSTDVPSGSKMSLWLYDVHLDQVTALIKNELAASSTYAWTLPTASSACDTSSNLVCGTDLIPGREYGIEADLYTGDPANASYGAQAYTTDVFTITQ